MATNRRRKQGIFFGAAIAVAVVFTVVGCGHDQKNAKSATPATSTPPAAVLDGTYRLDQDGAKLTTNGAPAPAPTLTRTYWYAFRSSCGSTGCAATGTRLDNNNHQVARTPASTTDMRFVGGHWQKVPARDQQHEQQCLGPNGTVVAGTETKIVAVSWEPQPDGTLRGVRTETVVTNECGHQGLVWQYPMVATRVGDVPPGVTVADPPMVAASPPTSSPAPAVAGPALNGTYRLDLDNVHRTTNGIPASHHVPNATAWYAFRSVCTSSGCVATGAQLSDTNHQDAAGINPRVLHFADGHWQTTPYVFSAQCIDIPNQTLPATDSWSLEPQPDGTLRGVETTTSLTSDCPGEKVFETPMVVTRDGDVPPAVVLADPALFF